MIYVLSLLACLSAQPNQCERYELQVQACDAGGIGQLAAWALQHPEYRVEKWNCSQGTPT